MKQKIKKMKITTKIIIIDNLLYLFFGLIMYPLIPFLLNYPPNSIDNEFQSSVVGMQYSVQFIFIFILGIILNCVILNLFFRKINSWEKLVKNNDKDGILKVRKICADGIYKLVPIHVLVNAIILFIIFTAASTQFSLTLKLSAIICIWTTVSDLLLYVFTGKIFNNVLNKTYEFIKDEKNNISRSSIGNKMIIQYTSCILVIILVMSFYSYSRISFERGEFLKEKELNNLNSMLKSIDTSEIYNIIENSEDWYFLLTEEGKEVYSKKKLNKFVKEYILDYPDSNRTYFQYGSSIEGVFSKIRIEDKNYYIGKMYSVMPISYTITFYIFDIALIVLYYIIIRCFTNNIKYQLGMIANSLNEIGDRRKKTSKQLPITSNDEFADLVMAYNKVQINNEKIIEELKEKQEVIVKQQQLVSIGELAGGVAHDINTPISAIKTGIVMLNQMGEKTEEEKEILQRMDNCATKIINIVNSMRNQIRNLGSDNSVKFKIGDVVNDIKIITYHEVAKNKSEVIVNIKDDLEIQGDPTKLGQVLTNLVVNAAQAYGPEHGGKVEVTVEKGPKSMAIIKVADYAGGLDPKIAPYIFKNILTTKGTAGTGLGLYLAYSVIKGNFNGDITFDTAEGEGTTFYIAIPRS